MIDEKAVRILGDFWQYVLGLTDYECEFKVVPMKELQEKMKMEAKIYGMVNDDYYHKKAVISIAQEITLKQASHTIIHELLHIILNRSGNIFDTVVNEYLTGAEQRIIRNIYNDATETLINQIATAFLTYKRMLKRKEVADAKRRKRAQE